MKTRMSLLISLLLILVLATFINSCSENSIASPDDPAESIGISVDDIQWVAPTPEFVQKLQTLKKSVYEEKVIIAAEGGMVGGENTFNNSVVFPPNALKEDALVSIQVIYTRSGFVWIEFLPSGSFNDYVDVTLSWAHLDIDAPTIEDLKIYFSQDDGRYWFPLDSNAAIDYKAQTVTFKINHFTRFGWGI